MSRRELARTYGLQLAFVRPPTPISSVPSQTLLDVTARGLLSKLANCRLGTTMMHLAGRFIQLRRVMRLAGRFQIRMLMERDNDVS